MTVRLCTLPGQSPVRLDSLDGNIIIIGEALRPVADQFVLRAKAAGCLTEDEFNALKSRMLSADPAAFDHQSLPGKEEESDVIESDDDFPGLPATPQPPVQVNVRSEQIKQAVTDLINNGNPADFTAGGVPKVESLKERLGFDVTAQERDTAFEAAKG